MLIEDIGISGLLYAFRAEGWMACMVFRPVAMGCWEDACWLQGLC